MPESSQPADPAELVALLDIAKKRMEAYLMLEPEVYREIHDSMERMDYFSVKAEASRMEQHRIARRLKERKVPATEIAEITGLPLAEVEKL